MAISEFPPVDCADENGLLAIGGDLEIESLLKAYKAGIFPWPINEEYPLAWFSPDPRGILEYSDLNVSRSLEKTIKKNRFQVTFNKNFEEVILNCSSIRNRKDQSDTWITEDIIHSYIKMHHKGFAYSVDVKEDNQLVGGIYGVCIDGFVSGESMFYKRPNASKVGLVTLMRELNKIGINWLDTQMVTPVVEKLGGKEIDRSIFLDKLSLSLKMVESNFLSNRTLND